LHAHARARTHSTMAGRAASPSTRVAAAAAARALASALLCSSLAAAAVYLNPTIGDTDTPDPGVAYDPASGRWWASTTTGGAPDFYALHSSADLGTWRAEGFIYPHSAPQPSWIKTDTWAPELHLVAGRWIAVYVGRSAATGLLSIGVGWSTSASPAGPWVDSGAPLIMDTGADAQGQIDPTLVVDDGSGGAPLLVFKEDGNFDGKATPFHYARLIANGTALAPGEAQRWKSTSLLDHTLPWEGALVEAPWLVRGPAGSGFSAWYLFYSGNGFGSDYAVGVARSDALLGPYEKHGDSILAQNEVFNNPGHCSVVAVGGGDTAIVYHAYVGADRSARHMMLDAIQWNATSGWPQVAGRAPSGGGFLPLPHAR
jgi:beta-xylosidase